MISFVNYLPEGPLEDLPHLLELFLRILCSNPVMGQLNNVSLDM